MKFDTVMHMTGCCSTVLVCVCHAVHIEQCHASAVHHLTSHWCFENAGLVNGGEAGLTIPFRGPDRDFNPYPSESG